MQHSKMWECQRISRNTQKKLADYFFMHKKSCPHCVWQHRRKGVLRKTQYFMLHYRTATLIGVRTQAAGTYTDTHTLHIHTIPVRSLDTPSHSMVFLYFYCFLHSKFRLTLETSKLWRNTYGIMYQTKNVNHTAICFMF